MSATLTIIYEDEDLVAIDKPGGLLTHRTKISEDTVFALQMLRKQLGYQVHPIHRLDRATTGVLLFAKNSGAASLLGRSLQEHAFEKTYLAIIRGYVADEGIMDRALFSETKQRDQSAETYYKCLLQTEMPWPVSRYPTARYSLVMVQPKTGRHHQIRKHFAQLRHPVIGDRRHGDVKHNNYWRDNVGHNRLWLHAWKLRFPWQGKSLELCAELDEDWQVLLKQCFGEDGLKRLG